MILNINKKLILLILITINLTMYAGEPKKIAIRTKNGTIIKTKDGRPVTFNKKGR